MTPSDSFSKAQSCPINPEQRERMIAELAYYRAEQRGFKGGQEEMLNDWLEAENEVDKIISGELSGGVNPAGEQHPD